MEALNGTAGSPLMSYYPRGTASLGLIDAAAGLVVDNAGGALFYRPTASPMRVPVFSRADWAAADPAKRVPTLDFPGAGGEPTVTNRDLLPGVLGAANVRDLAGVTVTGPTMGPGGSATVSYVLPVASTVRASVWDGPRRVRELASTHQEAGRRSFEWDGTDGAGDRVADGRYAVRIDVYPDDASAVRPASADVWVNSDVPGLARDWYFAEGYTGASPGSGDFQEYILVANPGGGSARLKATFMLADGRTLEKVFSASPHSRLTIAVDDILPDAEVSVHLHADADVAAERSMYFSGGRAGHDSIGVNGPSTAWYLAEGCTRAGFDEYVQVQNPGEADASVAATFMASDGSTEKREYAVGPHTRFTIHVNQVMDGRDVSTMVESDSPVVVERSQYLNGMTAGTCSLGARSLSRTWYLAEGYTGGGFEEYVLLQNPGQSASDATLFFMDRTGTSAIRNYTVAGRSRFTVPVGDVLPGSEVSVRVSADAPLAVERAMYWNGRSEGHASIGTPSPDGDWYLPDCCTAGGFETWVQVQNPTDGEHRVTMTFMEPSGKTTERSYTLAPRSRFTVDTGTVLPSAEFSVSADADGPVIVEKSVYFAGRAGGTCSIGARGAAR